MQRQKIQNDERQSDKITHYGDNRHAFTVPMEMDVTQRAWSQWGGFMVPNEHRRELWAFI